MEWVQSFEGMPSWAFDIAWSPDGTRLAATGGGTDEDNVIVWSVADGSQQYLKGHRSVSVMGLSWHPTYPMIATGADDRTVRLWNLATGTSRLLCQLEVAVKSVAWSPDGGRLAVTEEDGTVSIWDVQKDVPPLRARVHEATVYQACWCPDGQALVTCGTDGAINVLATDDLRIIHTFRGYAGSVGSICLSPDGSLIASASEDTTIRVWDLARGTEAVVLERHTSWALAVEFSPNSAFLASASASGSASGSESRIQGIDGVRCGAAVTGTPVAFIPRNYFIGRGGVAFHPSKPLLAVKELRTRRIDCYRIDYAMLGGVAR